MEEEEKTHFLKWDKVGWPKNMETYRTKTFLCSMKHCWVNGAGNLKTK